MSYTKHFYVERALQNFSLTEGTIANLIISFAAFAAKKNKLASSVTVTEALLGNGIPAAIKEFIKNEGAKWKNSSLSTFEKVSAEDIKSYIIDTIETENNKFGHKDFVLTIPSSLNDLCANILDIKKDDSVIDLGAGFASFLIHVAKNYPCKNLVGIEISRKTWLYGNMLSYLESVAPEIKLGDVLTLDETKKYDKILAFPELASNMTISFVEKILKLLSDNGRAVVFLTQGFLVNEGLGFKEERKNLIEGGFVESVIELPSGVLQPYTSINTVLLVLSKGNDKSRIVDASDFYENTRRGTSTLTVESAKSIYKMLTEESKKSRVIKNEAIKEKDYNLASRTYFLEEKIILSGVEQYEKLSDLVETKIMRGAQIKASELEELGSDEDTGIYYAFAKDIKDNRLVSGLKPLKKLEAKLEAITLKNNDILLVMAMTETLKAACVDKLEGRKIIPASNIYIIRLNKEKILPLYFKMLLETSQATQLFNAFGGGGPLRAISVDFLNKLQIPLPPLELQKELVQRYQKIEDESEILRQRLAALAREKGEVLASLF
ncbi:hypothetical protein DYE50_06585 [Treponema ruminis]|uniref:site-specific DNA-methyltransferase (adenine-specific) n=1 Tax=Treponema ruminis TaxID=744515 RepID=A0A7W8LMJ1_9SPIR|nr:N-6 DNA methylase [Treponema ruminis]MBB5226532.1 type I restriction enzyme M protein [Treponema ruminis]QSI02237.1 hypothetical protein DYE50_06585 [Treponema ruminis]